MIPTAFDIIKNFSEFIEKNSYDTYIIQWRFWTVINWFLFEMKKTEKFSEKKSLYISQIEKKQIEKFLQQNSNSSFDFIVITENIFEFSFLEDLLSKYNISGKKIIFTHLQYSQKNENTGIFIIPTISFREYSESKNQEIIIKNILKNEGNFEVIEKNFDEYLLSGSFIEHISYPEKYQDFEQLLTNINQELFEKERNIFTLFIQTLASEIGNLYKEEKIAKILGISRRKVVKYTHLLEKHNIISFLSPFCEKPEEELSRHKKIFFTDLSFVRWALWSSYALWNNKILAIKNCIFIELSRKLDWTHELLFWKKKYGTEIDFILKNKETNKLTPIEITEKNQRKISLVLKSFYSSYSSRVEHSMILGPWRSVMQNYQNTPFFILPYWAV